MSLYMAWRGIHPDTQIWVSRCDAPDRGWSPQQPVPWAFSTHGPALAAVGGRLVMAWKSSSDQAIWWASSDGAAWTSPRRVDGAGTSDSPALLARADGLYMWWKGIAGDQDVWRTRDLGAVDGGWVPQAPLIAGESGPGGLKLSARGPSVAGSFGGATYLAIRGYDDIQNPSVFRSGDGWGWDPEATPAATLHFAGTSNGPAIAHTTVFADGPDALLLAWKGADDDSGIWVSRSDDGGGARWSPQAHVNNVGTSERPALRPWAGSGDPTKTYAAWKGVGNDPAIYWADANATSTWFDPASGEPIRPGQRRIEGRGTSGTPALAVL